MVNEWVGKVVKIELSTGKYYKGTVEDENDDTISLIDIRSQWVTISKQFLISIQEVNE